ncbi:asparagine synthase-related protein [Halocalculus aciditolerans]|uniref:Asparagine synthetase domain-containing protein n=1 Tax=Halocalculus aciditolerans TaxID=1383812 RepID=A0A830F2E0_9EURY|nr:asparagine synthase-related protein [Halocalculus aciditolerans]GGL55781.1 hypothetical protein GCM10009039_12480 [Halocalculus aciditolerans]
MTPNATTMNRSTREWTREHGVAVRGRAFRDGDHLTGSDLAAHVAGVDSLDAFADRLDELNGFFAVVAESGEKTFAGVDHVRSIPLWYAPEAGVVTDDPRAVREELEELTTDAHGLRELLVTGTVFGGRTRYEEVYTVRPGEAVELAAGEVSRTRYARYWPRTDARAGDDGVLDRIDAAFGRAGDRLSEVVGDRQAVVALSGGHDSRLVATLLAERGHDVLAYSYGRPEHRDVVAAKRVADSLDIPWEYVEYTTQLWRDWYCSDERARFVAEHGTLDSIPNYGSLPALSALRERGLVDDDAVCLSGQTVAGTSESVPVQLDAQTPDGDDVVDAVVAAAAHWRYDHDAFDRRFRDGIRARLPDAEISTVPEAFAALEHAKWDSYHTRYFVADVRQYDRFDLDWWLPLWDREFVDAWSDVPFAERRGKRAYATAATRRYAAAADVPLSDARALAAAPETPSSVESIVERLADRATGTPLAALLAPLYWRFRRSRGDYDDHPLGWWGIVPRALFDALYTGREDVHSFQTLAAAGRADYVEGRVRDPPKRGVVPLDADALRGDAFRADTLDTG